MREGYSTGLFWWIPFPLKIGGKKLAQSFSGQRSGSSFVGERLADWFNSKIPVIFTLPSLVFIAVVCVFPLIFTLYLSFQAYELALPIPPRFIGLENYIRAFTDSRFWGDISRSLLYVFGSGILQLSIGIGIALLLDRDFRGRRGIVSLFLIPMVLAPVVVGFVWRMLYNERFGPINFFLTWIGFQGIPWLSDPHVARIAVILANGWEWFPFMMLAILAALQSLPQDFIDAARVDGASSFQVFRRIKLPLLAPIIVTIFLIRAIEDFKLFDLLYVVVGRGGTPETENLNMYTYIQGFRFFSLGYASALSCIQLIVVFFVIRVLIKRLPIS